MWHVYSDLVALHIVLQPFSCVFSFDLSRYFPFPGISVCTTTTTTKNECIFELHVDIIFFGHNISIFVFLVKMINVISNSCAQFMGLFKFKFMVHYIITYLVDPFEKFMNTKVNEIRHLSIAFHIITLTVGSIFLS